MNRYVISEVNRRDYCTEYLCITTEDCTSYFCVKQCGSLVDIPRNIWICGGLHYIIRPCGFQVRFYVFPNLGQELGL